MGSKKRKPEPAGHDEDIPAWVADQSPGRTAPYTEKELDLLVEGTLESIRDTASWCDLVERVGEEEARGQLRVRIAMRGGNANRLTRH